jgi:hypothetical protein
MYKKHRLSAAFLGAALAALLLLGACAQPEFLQSEMPDDGPPIATSQQAARRFVEKVAAAAESAPQTKRLEITVTQAEVTSFLNIGAELAGQMRQVYGVDSLAELQQLQGAQGLEGLEGIPDWAGLLQGDGQGLGLDLPDLNLLSLIKEPQVYFKSNGQIVIRGYAQALGQRQPLRLVLAPHASDGELALDFVEGKLGPVPVPELIIDQIGSGLARLILAGRDYVQVSLIVVDNGSLTIRGGYVR